MDVYEYKVPKHNPCGRIPLFTQEIKESRHGVPDRIAVQGHVHGLTNVDLPVTVAGKVRRSEQTGGDARREHLPVPGPVILVSDEAWVFSFQDAPDALPHFLISLKVAARRHRIALLTVLFICRRIPVVASNALDELGSNAIAFDR